MSAILFDTLAFTKKMTTAGMPPEQAEALAESQAELIENNIATKRDLKDLEDLEDLEVALNRDIKDLENRLLIKITVIVGVIVGLFSSFNNLF